MTTLNTPLWGNQLTSKEIVYMQNVLRELEKAPWASPLLRLIDERGGIKISTQPELFEARVAYELYRRNIEEPQYEFKTGVGESSVDSRIRGFPEFYIEVVSLRTSGGALSAVKQQGDFYSSVLRSDNLQSKDTEKQSVESEILTLQSKIGEKVHTDGREIKFPPPTKNLYNVLIVDVRGFKGSDRAMKDLINELHLSVVGNYPFSDYLDGREIRMTLSVPSTNGASQRIDGLFDYENALHPMKAIEIVRSRIHFIHFVCEKEFTPGELTKREARLIAVNGSLSGSDRQNITEILEKYPLKTS